MHDMTFFREAEAAFFDLDNTILQGDSDLAWGLLMAGRSARGLADLLAILRLALPYQRGTIDPEAYVDCQRLRIARWGGDYEAQCSRFFERRGASLIRPWMADLIGHYRSVGIPTAIITAQNRSIARHFAEHLGVDELIANDFSGPGGSPLMPICLGEGKIARAEGYAASIGTTLSRCAFYADSVNDAPLLELVGLPVAVTPDKRLARIAKGKGWPTLQPERRVKAHGSGYRLELDKDIPLFEQLGKRDTDCLDGKGREPHGKGLRVGWHENIEALVQDTRDHEH